MNRMFHTFPELGALLDGLGATRPVEALLVQRLGLIDILRRSLFELHERRRQVAGTPAEPEFVQRIKYWEEILAWAQQQPGSELVLMDRARIVQ